MSKARRKRRIAAERTELAREVTTAGRDELMEAAVGACALIAYADVRERRRVLQLMRALPAFQGFSTSAVAEELVRHERAFEHEPYLARERVLEMIAALQPGASNTRMLLSACQQVLEADGTHHPHEYDALRDVGKALKAA